MLLQEAWNLISDANYSKAIKLCETYLASGDDEFKTEAYRLAALAYNKLKDFTNSAKYYQLLALQTNEPEDWLELTLAYVLSGNNNKSFSTFKKALEAFDKTESSSGLSIANMRFFFLKDLFKMDKFSEAFIQLDELRKIYEEHEITDSTYLYMNSVPEFNEFLEYATKILTKVKSSEESIEWYKILEEQIDDEGRLLIKKEIEKLKT